MTAGSRRGLGFYKHIHPMRAHVVSDSGPRLGAQGAAHGEQLPSRQSQPPEKFLVTSWANSDTFLPQQFPQKVKGVLEFSLFLTPVAPVPFLPTTSSHPHHQPQQPLRPNTSPSCLSLLSPISPRRPTTYVTIPPRGSWGSFARIRAKKRDFSRSLPPLSPRTRRMGNNRTDGLTVLTRLSSSSTRTSTTCPPAPSRSRATPPTMLPSRSLARAAMTTPLAARYVATPLS